MSELKLAVAGFMEGSRCNGPGRRMVLWLQGCSLRCPGCFNPSTWGKGGELWSVEALTQRILQGREAHEGLTLSGGEPFEQAPALLLLLKELRKAWPKLELMAFSGRRLEELRAGLFEGSAELLEYLDLLVDGPYRVELPGQKPWRSSQNQRLWILGRSPQHLTELSPQFEIQIQEDQILLSGAPPLELRRCLS